MSSRRKLRRRHAGSARLVWRAEACCTLREVQVQGSCGGWRRCRALVSARSGAPLRRRRGAVAAGRSAEAGGWAEARADARLPGARRGINVVEGPDRRMADHAARMRVGQDRRRRPIRNGEAWGGEAEKRGTAGRSGSGRGAAMGGAEVVRAGAAGATTGAAADRAG